MVKIKGELTLQMFYEIIFEDQFIEIDDQVKNKIKSSFDFLETFSTDKIIYGVNTGFGPMAQYKIKDAQRIALQYNLIKSHATGSGNVIPPIYVKASMLARLNTLALGKSGVHDIVIDLMTTLINKNITPIIYEHGGVGASGDLVQLAHIALTLIGDGEVMYKNKRLTTKKVFEIENLKPIPIKIREGIALMNGTSVMTGIGVINTIYSRRLLNWMIAISEEVNSANDNPIVDLESQHVYHGGNFHGDYVSLEMDKLKLVVTKMSMLAERQLNYLLNPKLNGILPPFVNLGTLGLNFGMQGAQFTATSTTAENQMLSNPMYVHSIPNNNDNQDIVSMGANAALITKKVIDNTFEVLAIELITIVQAIEYLEVKDKVSSKTKKMYEDVRKIIPEFKEDIILYPFISKVKDFIKIVEI